MTSDEQVWLSRAQVATRLGVSTQTVYRWTREGRLPAYKGPGGQYRHKIEDIDSVVEKIPTIPADISKQEYADMLEAMLGPAEAEGGFTYAPDSKEW
jgi:excisionase family DNA binding protein